MNKRDARELAYSRDWTVAEVFSVLNRRPDEGSTPSRVNRQFTVDQVRAMFVGALTGKERFRHRSDILTITNCFREFGAPLDAAQAHVEAAE